MNTERDKFLTEAVGECWHEDIINEYEVSCTCCRKYAFGGGDFVKEYLTNKTRLEFACNNNNFSTWTGFGKLWEWTMTWSSYKINEFYDTVVTDTWAGFTLNLVNPNRFANAVYEYLKRSKYENQQTTSNRN